MHHEQIYNILLIAYITQLTYLTCVATCHLQSLLLFTQYVHIPCMYLPYFTAGVVDMIAMVFVIFISPWVGIMCLKV